MYVNRGLRASFLLLVFSLIFGIVNAHACSATAQDAFTVGSDNKCSYNTIQDAIDAATCAIGTKIYITSELTYSAQHLTITNKNISLIGRPSGTSCNAAIAVCGTIFPCPTSPLETISGSGASNSAGVITIRGTSNVTVQYLTISGGNHSDSGGGIDYAGIGTLTLNTSTVFDNTARDGGGIRFQGNGGEADLILHANTFITNNTATATGGGIRAEGQAKVTIDDAQIWIEGNEAQTGYGGGIALVGGASAHIGSPGYKIGSYAGVIYGNTAQYGGGMAGVAQNGSGGSGSPEFDIVATDPNHPVRIEQNRAYHTGGGIYLGAYEDNDGGGGALAKMDGAQIDSNAAQEGSGIYADTDSSILYTGGGSVWFYASDCAIGVECNTVSNNRAVDSADNPTAGSAILIQTQGTLTVQQLTMRDNQGAHAIRVADSLGAPLKLDSCLLADNIVTGELVTPGNAAMTINQCTFAHNTIGGASVLRAQDNFSLTNSIFAQGFLQTLAYTGTGLTVDYVLSGETDSLSTGQHFLSGDPSFVDPDHGDFHLLANSLAIDFAPAVVGDDHDLDNLPRDQDMPNVNLYGVRDLGAYERQLRYCGAADTIFCNGFDNP